MRVLILGGAGFIGSHLRMRLLEDGDDVVVADDLSRGHGRVANQVALTDPHSWDRLPRDWGAVYMLAAVVWVVNVEGEPLRVIQVNAQTVLRLLDWLPAGTRLFFASTSEVYAGSVMAGIAPVPTPERVPLSVPDITNPRFTYAASKILGECAILHSGANAVIGRFHNVYGPRMGMDHAVPAIGMRLLEYALGDMSFVVPRWKLRRRFVELYGCDQRRAFCYIDDAVDAMIRLMTTDYRGVVNVGNDREEVAVEELAGEIAAALDMDEAFIRRLPAPAGSVERRCPDLTLLRQLTGYEPRVTLVDGLKRTMDWYVREMR